MTDSFLVIGPLQVDNLMACHPDIVMGYPMPTAIAGFGYKIGLDINKAIGTQAFTVTGTSIILHEHSLKDGHAKHPPAHYTQNAGSIVDEFRARALLSFVVGLESHATSSQEMQEHQDEALSVMKSEAPGWLFGGGKVFPTSKSVYKAVDQETLAEEVGKLPAGHLLVDRRDVLETRIQETACDPLDALLDLVQLTPVPAETTNEEPDEKKKNVRPRMARLLPGWIVPVVVGYQSVEKPSLRGNHRSNGAEVPHVYAESLYSIAEYKPVRTLIAKEGEDFIEGSQWSHHHNPTSSTFYVSALGPINTTENN
ncbi:type I-F CRISPR-associated protein Csy2 [Roseibium sp. RKSG952]|uniref:type I-F CRISPR-associated protein Csy2 n=1 Tax=Roseibium sp. RKSG952 TaxID=2529384 RepID=UPI0012BCC00C|nr:type I-F CRISPR-associated protein Csy2 [Roseibium sp. RKSG952]MTH95506.1 hypothetical protein [Roseibium sp. RKSG952]